MKNNPTFAVKNNPSSGIKNQSIAVWLEKARLQKTQRALKYKQNDSWVDLSYDDYLKKIFHFQTLLKENKIKKGQFVALISSTRWEWAAFDVAALSMGVVLVPIYPNLSDDDVEYILNHSECALAILENSKITEQFNRVQSRQAQNKNESDQKLESSQKKLIPFLQIDQIDLDASYVQDSHIQEMIDGAHTIKASDPATLIYTSGTTGKPKGVLHAHKALISEISEAFDLFAIYPEDISLAFLPFAHVMGRVEHWGALYKTSQVAYAESIDALRKNLVEIQPTFLMAVPRIFEKIYSGIMTKVAVSQIKKKLFDEALSAAQKIAYYRQTGQVAPLFEALKYEALTKLAFTPVKQAFGGRLRFAISGGAPLSSDLEKFFSYMGIQIFEGYGLTETFAAICVNTYQHKKNGTVGKPIGDVKIKFAADGEILVHSDKCMTEYYKNPEATAGAMVDDPALNSDSSPLVNTTQSNSNTVIDKYFATGDIGEFTADGFLKITDRKKDLIKTSGGKYVAPQKLEGLLKQEPVISNVFICGDQQKFVAALISVESLAAEATSEERDAVLTKIQTQVQNINSQLASYESIKKYEVLFEVWSVENGCLTPSMKVKRKFIEKRYAHIIDSLYNKSSD